MLVLSRKIGEAIILNDDTKIVVIDIQGKQVKIGIDAPKETKIYREEIYKAIQAENQHAAKSKVEDEGEKGKEGGSKE